MSYRVQRSRAHYGRSPSPATRTLKSQEEAIDALSKENFDLKMRLQELQDHVAGSGGRRGDGAARHLTTRDGMRETAALKEHLAQMEREIEEKNRLLREVRNRQHDHVSCSSQGRRGFYRKEQGGKCFHDAACARIPTQTMFSHTHTHSHSHSHTHTHTHTHTQRGVLGGKENRPMLTTTPSLALLSGWRACCFEGATNTTGKLQKCSPSALA